MSSDQTNKPFGFLHVDVDGLWAVRKCYGAKAGESYRHDPVWEEGVPNLVEWFESCSVPASFFLVGCDLKLEAKRKIARQLHEAGHEIGNHSWSHTIGLTRFPVGKAIKEIRATQNIIEKSGLPKPIGFRSPGYDIDARILRAVEREGLSYDASILPTYLSPILRVADKLMSVRSVPGKRQFGRFAYWRAPKEPYHPRKWDIRKPAKNNRPNSILEFPVGVMPRTTFPLTGSAIFAFGPEKVNNALNQIAEEGRSVMILLHGIDGLDCKVHQPIPEKKIKAGGFNLSEKDKRDMIKQVLDHFETQFEVVRTKDVVQNNLLKN